ncbi:MAG TPA: molybdenum cofactor biosynthesis protein MoaE [Thermoleophilaceae bacterium]|nr:molybdenum cofactor biosynthesis protein MoaE [Thermoleophilaceae bacterium]
MEVTVRLFAMLRERAGASEVTLELPDGARVRDAIDSLGDVAAGVPVVMAVNREYADADVVLSPHDELALVPPVSGGETVLVHARVTDAPLSIDALTGLVRNPAAGAVVVFEGVTREVDALEYEAYVEMAEEKMASILAEVKERHGLTAIAAEHRVGLVPLSQPSVIVAASAPHRGEAFAGAREAIDRIKAEAPIWKKEIEGGAGGWVEGTLP